MTTSTHKVQTITPIDFDNGNADFWLTQPAAKRIGGEVTSTDTGVLIKGAQVYSYEVRHPVNVDVVIEKHLDDEGSYYTVTAVLCATGAEVIYDEMPESLTEAFESLSAYAPPHLYAKEWRAGPIAGEPEELGNHILIEDVFWSERGRREGHAGDLKIYVRLKGDSNRGGGNLDHYFSIFHKPGGWSEELTFGSFDDVLEYLEERTENRY